MILFLKPYFEPKVWAGTELNKIYDCKHGTGEAWIVSGYAQKSSIINNGPYKGKTLRYLWREHPELFGSIAYEEPEFQYTSLDSFQSFLNLKNMLFSF